MNWPDEQTIPNFPGPFLGNPGELVALAERQLANGLGGEER